MSTYLAHVVIDALDPSRLASFWNGVLGWTVVNDDAHEIEITGSPDDVPLIFVPTSEPKRAKNRMHLDLAARSPAEEREVVQRCLDLGATRADIGQGDVAWTVLADPEGNEFCVLPPFEGFAGAIAAICLDGQHVERQRAFWSAATGWEDRDNNPRYAVLRRPGATGPALTMGPEVAPKDGKNRIHMDVRPRADGDQDAEAERLVALGAKHVDIGQKDVRWVVLADPEDNEFCVLTPREE